MALWTRHDIGFCGQGKFAMGKVIAAIKIFPCRPRRATKCPYGTLGSQWIVHHPVAHVPQNH